MTFIDILNDIVPKQLYTRMKILLTSLHLFEIKNRDKLEVDTDALIVTRDKKTYIIPYNGIKYIEYRLKTPK